MSLKLLLSSLDNRETASLVWLTAFALWVCSMREIRKSLIQVLRSFLEWKVSTPLVLMGLYVVGMVAALRAVGLWDQSRLKITLLWYLAALPVFFNAVTDEDFSLRKAAAETIKIAVLLDFLMNLHVLSFPLEMLLIPFATLIGVMLAVAEMKPEFASVRKPLSTIMAILGLSLFAFACYRTRADFGKFATLGTLLELLIPIVLALLFLPFVYAMALVARYEMAFTRLKFFVKDPELQGFATSRIIRACHLDLRAVTVLSKCLYKMNLQSREAILKSLRQFATLNTRPQG